MTDVWFVYELLCPDTSEVRYVGQSVDPPMRFRTHFTDALARPTGGTRLQVWLNSLLEQNKLPLLRIRETCSSKAAALDRERHWINHWIGQGVPLLNGRPGTIRDHPLLRNILPEYLTILSAEEEEEETGARPEEAAEELEPGKEIMGFRLGAVRRQRFIELTRQANYTRPSHFMKALVDHLSQIEGPFNVREIGLPSPWTKEAPHVL